MLHVASQFQYFNKEFTSTYLKKYVSRTGYDILVHYNKNRNGEAVKFKLGKDRKQAILTSNWMNVVDGQKLKFKEGDVIMFWFRRASHNILKVYVDILQAGDFRLGRSEERRVGKECRV